MAKRSVTAQPCEGVRLQVLAAVLISLLLQGEEKAHAIYVYPHSAVFPIDGVLTLNMNLMPSQVQAIFGDGSEPVYIEITAEGKTYPRQCYSFVPLALRVPVDGKTLAFGDDGKIGLALKTLPATNQFLTKSASGELVWGTPTTATAANW